MSGHRPDGLRDADAPALERLVRRELERSASTRATGSETANGRVSESPHLLSSLAEGSDRVVAHIALALGFRLDVLLPLPVPEYERDFDTRASRDEFRGLLAVATSVLVVPTEEPEGDRVPPARSAAYLAAGRAVIAESDILLAVWDGDPPKGPGGTGQIVSEALGRDVPVLWIHSAAPHPVRLLVQPDDPPERRRPWLALEPGRLPERLAAARDRRT